MSKTMKSNGAHSAKSGTSPINRVAGKVNGAVDSGEEQNEAAETKRPGSWEGKTGKVLLGIGAAVVAIVATEYALRKFTKTGGIIPHLIRLEKLASVYMATVEKP
ncbi:MAG TPA: hypothetical protein VL860_10705 [Planctomycetota bacterium]|nr:hypothetical protein [Planctomycetota bacterium]